MSYSPELSDDAVISRVIGGEKDAYRILVDRYGARMLGFCRGRLGSEDEAADAAQDVFIRAYSSLPRFRRGESFSAWLFAIAANQVRTRFRMFGSMRRRLEAVARGTDAARDTRPEDDPAVTVLAEADAAALRDSVAALPRETRGAVELYYFAGLPVAECARALGIGEEAVKSRLFRARRQLRRALEPAQPVSGSGGIRS